jgi:hypothetical protein
MDNGHQLPDAKLEKSLLMKLHAIKLLHQIIYITTMVPSVDLQWAQPLQIFSQLQLLLNGHLLPDAK